MPDKRCPYVCMMKGAWLDPRLARPPTDAGSPLSFAVGCPPVGSCTLDPTQALAGWQAGRQTSGAVSSLSLSLTKAKRRRRTKRQTSGQTV